MEYTLERIPMRTVRLPEISMKDVPAYCEALKTKTGRKASKKARAAATEVQIADERASVVVCSSKALAHVGGHFVDNGVGVSFSTIFASSGTYFQLFFDCSFERAQELVAALNIHDDATKQKLDELI